MRRVPSLVVIGVVGWWGLNAFIVTNHLLAFRSARGQPMALSEILPGEIASAAIWALCTLWLLWWTARSPLERERWVAPLVTLLLAVLAAVVFRAAAVVALDPWIDWYNTPPRWGVLLASSMLRNFLVGCVIVGLGHAMVFAQRSRTREHQAQALQEQLTQARLDALSAQLNPHFLFNALNSIAEMVHHDADAADRMLVQLGGLLRHSLESTRRHHTPLHDEMSAIDCYIGIEQVRLGDRLRFSWDVDPAVLAALVPRLLLQPLVENAVAHAVAERESPSKVEVRAYAEGDGLVLEVLDEGSGTTVKPGFGVGLANARARLECLYGKAQALDIEEVPGGGTRVRVSMPLVFGRRDE